MNRRTLNPLERAAVITLVVIPAATMTIALNVWRAVTRP